MLGELRGMNRCCFLCLSKKRGRACFHPTMQEKAARVQLETEDERCERLRTTRERMAISRNQNTEERRYFRLRYDAMKRAGRTLWVSHCAQ